MVFVYGLLRGWMAWLRWIATVRHHRAQRRYARLDEQFNRFEQECKADEVSLGRPMGYAAQLRLLKLFEAKESARGRWVQRANRLGRRQRWEQRVAAFSGRKLPYSFGLLDMALVMRVLDHFGLGIDFAHFGSWIGSVL